MVGVKMHHKPLILLIWLGGVIIAFGGGLARTDRRYRLAAAARGRKVLPPCRSRRSEPMRMRLFAAMLVLLAGLGPALAVLPASN